MAVIPTQTDYELAQLKVRNSKVRIELLNFNFQTIDLIEGNVIEGSISIDATADIRRTCSISISVSDSSFMISEGGRIWLDKYIKIYEGIDNPRNGETEWWNLGIFIINNPNRVYNATTNTISFEGLDLMSKLTGRRNGQLPAITTLIPAGSQISNVVKQTITQLGNFNQYVIEDAGYTIPYDIKKDSGATVYDLLVEIRDLYPDWEMFFDVDGIFHWQKIPSGETEPIIIDFDQLSQPLIINDSVDVDFENVKNNIIVWGRLLDDGTQVAARTSDNIDDSPYNINKIGQINYVITDERIYNNDLARQRAKYELFLHARMNDAITLEIVPIYWLNDVNVKMNYTNKDNGIKGEYLIKSLSIPLSLGANMVINAIKIYPKEPPRDDDTNVVISEYPCTGQWYSSNQTQFPYLQ